MLSDQMLQMLEFNNHTLLQPFSSLTLMYVLLLLIFLILYKWFITSPATRNSPPSPPKLPIIGNLHQLGSYPYRSLEALAKRFGPDLMLLHFGSLPVLVVSSPETAREVLKTNGLVFSSRPKLIVFKKLLYDHRDVTAAPYGDYWRQMKSVFVLNLLSNKRVQSFRGVREEETRLMLTKIEQESMSSSPDHCVALNLSEILSTFTNDVSCRVALGRKYCVGEDGQMFRELLKEFMELMGHVNIGDYIPWLAWWSSVNGLNSRLDKVAKRFDDFLGKVILQHIDIESSDSKKNTSIEEDKDKKDFVDVLLSLQKEKATGFALDNLSIKAFILDVFAGGNDSYAILEWAMSELLRHPTVMNKLQNEVREIVGSKEMVTEDDLAGMNYLRAVLKETFRLYPTIPLLLPRVSTEDVKINGYDIKVNTQAIVNIWKISRDPKSFNNPEEFEPERFLNSSIDLKGNDFQLIPYGSGRRICPAIQYVAAIHEMALANLVHKFNWELPEGARGEDLDMTETTGLNMRRENPLKAIAIPYKFIS